MRRPGRAEEYSNNEKALSSKCQDFSAEYIL
jgi:hypothetical protein